MPPLRQHHHFFRPTDEIDMLSNQREIYADSLHHPQTLAAKVQSSPRGRWALETPTASLQTRPRPDPHGVSGHRTIANDAELTLKNRRDIQFSRSGFGGPDLPGFRDLSNPYSPRAQSVTNSSHHTLPPLSSHVLDVCRKYTGSVDPYGAQQSSRSAGWKDSSSRLCFRPEPAKSGGMLGRNNTDMVSPRSRLCDTPKSFDKNYKRI